MLHFLVGKPVKAAAIFMPPGIVTGEIRQCEEPEPRQGRMTRALNP